MPLISVTRLRIRSWRYFLPFVWQTSKSARQAERSAGFLGGRLLRNRKNTFWTLTVWQDEAAMNAFRSGAAHGRVMRKLLEWCDEAAVVHWRQETPDLPSWPDAHRRMMKDGWASKVSHPSAAHKSNQIPPPEPSRIEQALKPRLER